jgi:hypothetical protein
VVNGSGGGVVVILVTADASRIRTGQIEVVVDVALAALRSGVRASQRESRRGVIKSRRLPCCGRVARLASLRKALLHVVGIGRALESGQVAGNARRVG